MKQDKLTHLWNSQQHHLIDEHPELIIKKAKKQRSGQYISITVMSITVLILMVYAAYYIGGQWSSFSLGLVLMITSLTFRIVLEFNSLYRKENQLITLDSASFKKYLKRHHQLRLMVNYIITPICFAVYIFGFTKLLPYFKQIFSASFYLYLLISGFGSLVVIGLIIIRSVLRERAFLKKLQ